jgi:PPOX class probable F420-dependent enzyme
MAERDGIPGALDRGRLPKERGMSDTLPDNARRFLEARRFASLATINPDCTPQQSTIWYELDGDEILMNTARGRVKDRNLRRDPRASVCVEDGYAYVTISGHVRLNDDQEVAQTDIKRLAVLNHGPEKGEEQSRNQFSKQERVTVRLKIERVVLYGLS